MRIAAPALLATTLALAACAPYGEPGEAPVTGDCPAYDSRDWNAWIDAMPGPGAQRTLYITGEVDLPTPGWSVELIEGPADRMQPPGLRFRLEADAPGGMAAQVITPTQVRYSAPTRYSEIREITVTCGDSVLAVIEDVPVAQ